MTRMLSYLAGAFGSPILLAQTATTATPHAKVHISGTIRQCGEPVLGRPFWVRFEDSPLSPRIVKANDNGVYETDLPFGVWTMTLRAAPDDTTEFARPRHFQVSVSGALVLDIYLRPPVACSVAGTPQQRAAACWGEEFFQVPSATRVPVELAGAPLEVDLFGLHNQYWTPCSIVEGKGRHREFATYNLLSIEGDHVAYHPAEKILEASGDVLMQDESGEQKADSVRLYLEDGQVSALPRNH